MAINLNNKVSESDKLLVMNNASKENEYLDGFGPDDYDDYFGSADTGGNGMDDFDFEFDDIGGDDGWDSIDDLDTSSSDDGFFKNFGSNEGTYSNGANTGNNVWNAQQEQQKQKDSADELFDATVEVSKNTFQVIKEIFTSFKNRNIDDYGYLGAQALQVGGILSVVGILLVVIFAATGLGNSAVKLGINTAVIGIMNVGYGIIVMFMAGYYMSKSMDGEPRTVEEMYDADSSSNTNDIIENDDLWDDLFSDEDEEDNDDEFTFDLNEDVGGFEDNTKDEDMFTPSFGNSFNDNTVLSEEEALESVSESTFIGRGVLVDTFRRILPLSTPNFHESSEISTYSDDYATIKTICTKVFANLLNCDITDVECEIESVKETIFSYEIYIKRVKKLTKLDAMAREFEIYFRNSSTDLSVTASVDMEGDFYKVIVSKGTTTVVTMGDILRYDEYYEQIADEHNVLPLLCGIDSQGNAIIENGKPCDTMLIAGKPRSGKSWYVLAVIMSLLLFNSPEYLQMLIIDPKKTNLFKTVGLMPHVFGVHGDENIFDVLDDIIENEAEHRKKILSDNRCDDIWALWDKGIILPILYIVIDEYITVKEHLGEESKGLDSRLRIIISQLPSLGIRVLFVPHRATGVVDKTNRTMLQFKASVKSDIEDVKDTLGYNKWTRPLTRQGDVAMKSPSLMEPIFVRGVALTDRDSKNTEFIELAAKVFYKMGVDIPDMSRLCIACNRDPDEVRDILSGNTLREQFNASSLFDDM